MTSNDATSEIWDLDAPGEPILTTVRTRVTRTARKLADRAERAALAATDAVVEQVTEHVAGSLALRIDDRARAARQAEADRAARVQHEREEAEIESQIAASLTRLDDLGASVQMKPFNLNRPEMIGVHWDTATGEFVVSIGPARSGATWSTPSLGR